MEIQGPLGNLHFNLENVELGRRSPLEFCLGNNPKFFVFFFSSGF